MSPHAAVICPIHGTKDIDLKEYMRQMMKPDSFWTCPVCGLDGQFNDERYEELNFQEETE